MARVSSRIGRSGARRSRRRITGRARARSRSQFAYSVADAGGPRVLDGGGHLVEREALPQRSRVRVGRLAARRSNSIEDRDRLVPKIALGQTRIRDRAPAEQVTGGRRGGTRAAGSACRTPDGPGRARTAPSRCSRAATDQPGVRRVRSRPRSGSRPRASAASGTSLTRECGIANRRRAARRRADRTGVDDVAVEHAAHLTGRWHRARCRRTAGCWRARRGTRAASSGPCSAAHSRSRAR